MKNVALNLKVLLIVLVVSISSVKSQIQVKSGGKVLLGGGSVEGTDQLTIDALNKPIRAFTIRVNHSSDWGQSSLAKVTNPNTVNWVVNFNKRDRFFVAGAGWVYSNGNYLQSSDISLKTNIVNISNALSKVTQLRGVYFNYKPEISCNECGGDSSVYADSSINMGLIAQEVQAIVPEVVREIPGVGADSTSLLAISYPNLIALLIEAIKEQQQQINMCCGSTLMMQESSSSNLKQTNGKINNSKSVNQLGILFQNNPNPSNAGTTIDYEILNSVSSAGIYIYNLQGTQIKSYRNLVAKGKGSLTISPNELIAGVYYYTLIIDGSEVDTKKMILIQ